ncbi:MAG TPA: autotransporter outer membrane beta-barrel domain-containing protein, partial [Caulobacter sp.]|nr:autotransporter outer membrane beta-barrel domain-containing protein [Caulobacter sp.]
SASSGNAILARNINAAANAGTIAVTIATGQAVTAVSGDGVVTDSGLSTGSTTLAVAGNVTAAGAGRTGVKAISTTGAVTVSLATTGKIDADVGLDLTATTGVLGVSNAGLIVGHANGVQMTATGTGTGSITNTGTITGATNAVLVGLNGGAFTLNNSGILNGAVKVSGSNVATTTLINTASGVANFGAGPSSVSGNFVNAGIANIAAGGTVTFLGATTNSNRINFAGAGAFTTNGAMTNTGVINAQNNLTGNVITVGGAYAGGGQIFVDYSTATATADRVNIAGAVTGNTNVALNRVGPGGLLAGGFLPIVTVTPGAAASAFTSDTVFANSGFVLESFGQNPANNTQFGLVQKINPAATSLGGLSYIAEASSVLLDEPISIDLVTSGSAGTDRRFNLWLRLASSTVKQTVSTTVAGGGFSVASTDRFETEQQALQLGADLRLPVAGGGEAHIGVTAGGYDGDTRLSNGGQLGAGGAFFGGYVIVKKAAFTFDGTVRRERRDYDILAPALFGLPGKRNVDGSATVAAFNASYRFGGEAGFRAMPFLGFTYADSKIDDVQVDPSTSFVSGGDKSKIGQTGVRLSYRIKGEEQAMLEPFIGVAALKNWSRGDTATFVFQTPATTKFNQTTRSWDDAVRYSAGLTARTKDGALSGFVAGSYNDGSRFEGYSVTAGFRASF